MTHPSSRGALAPWRSRKAALRLNPPLLDRLRAMPLAMTLSGFGIIERALTDLPPANRISVSLPWSYGAFAAV